MLEFDVNDEEIGNGGNDEGVERRYPQRNRKDPVWMRDYNFEILGACSVIVWWG